MYTTVRRRRSLEQQLEKLKTKQKMEEEKVVRISYFLFVVVVLLLGLPIAPFISREKSEFLTKNSSRLFSLFLVAFFCFFVLFSRHRSFCSLY